MIIKYSIVGLSLVLFALSGCSTHGKGVYKKYAKKEGTKKHYSHPTMRPYVINGIRYHPQEVMIGDRYKGVASWYGPDFHGKLTSNGEIYNMNAMTAAHKTFPMNTLVKVTNQNNGLSTVVRVNDRGPFVATRIIDLSNAAARKIDMIATGTAPVVLEVIGSASKSAKKIKHTKKVLQQVSKKEDKAKYSLQIASFSNIEGAIRIQEKYDGVNGYKSIIKDTKTKNARVFKVLLKGFASREEAYQYKKLSQFKQAFIVRED